MYLSFVLLTRPYDVDGSTIVGSHARLFSEAPRPLVASSDGAMAELRSADGLSHMIALMPVPVPNREADMAASASLAALTAGGPPRVDHAAHLTVVTTGATGLQALVAHTRIVAACADAYGAVAVYEGNAGATHPTPFYLDVVTTMDPPVMVWTGVSVARVPPARTEILTLGVERMLGLPDMLVSAPVGAGGGALPFLFDLLLYAITRGGPLPDGDTVGRTAAERIPVRYVASPVEPTKTVARIELP